MMNAIGEHCSLLEVTSGSFPGWIVFLMRSYIMPVCFYRKRGGEGGGCSYKFTCMRPLLIYIIMYRQFIDRNRDEKLTEFFETL